VLCRVIYLACEEQRLERGVSEESFYLEVLRYSIHDATVALHEAIKRFIVPQTREAYQLAAERLEELHQHAQVAVIPYNPSILASL
jgi:hypothetical protein